MEKWAGPGNEATLQVQAHQLPRKNFPGNFLVFLPRKILQARGMHDNVGASVSSAGAEQIFDKLCTFDHFDLWWSL